MAITFRLFTLTCPSCDLEFETRAVASPTLIVSKGSDFHDRHRSGESVLPYFLHLCERCGFCAEERFYENGMGGTFRIALKDFVETRLTPNLRWAREYLADRYEHALKLAEFSDEPSTYMAELALRGAWASLEEQDPESERYFRRAAVQNYTTALQHYDIVEPRQRAQVTYLIGELWRRLGNEELARTWYEAVPEAITNLEEQQWLIALAQRQRFTPQEFI